MSKNFELLQQTENEQDLFETAGNPIGVVESLDRGPLPESNSTLPATARKSRSLPMRWPAVIEQTARHWRKQLERRQNARRTTNQDAITREEEVKLVQRVFSVGSNNARQVVLFSGIDEEAGSAAICLRSSEILTTLVDGPVCVLDAALRSPSLDKYIGLNNKSKGLSEAILENGPIQDYVRQFPGRNLWVMSSGLVSSETNALLFSDRLLSRVTELRSVFKYVVVHASPFNLDPLAIPLSHLTDGVVLVVEANSTRRERARRVKKSLEVANVPVLGVVLNNRTFPIPESLYRRL